MYLCVLCGSENKERLLLEFRLPPSSKWEPRSSGLLAASSGISLPSFRDSLSVPSSRVNNPKGKYHYSLRNNPAERSCQFFPCTASTDWSWQRICGVFTERYEMNVWTFEHAVSGCTNSLCSVYTKSWYSCTAVCINGLSQTP